MVMYWSMLNNMMVSQNCCEEYESNRILSIVLFGLLYKTHDRISCLEFDKFLLVLFLR